MHWRMVSCDDPKMTGKAKKDDESKDDNEGGDLEE